MTKRIVFAYKGILLATSSYTQDFRTISEDYIKSSGGVLKIKEILATADFNEKYNETVYLDKLSLFKISEIMPQGKRVKINKEATE